jgi:hypothetical protein
MCFGCDIDIRVLKGNMHAGVRVPTLPPPPPASDVASTPDSIETGITTETAIERESATKTEDIQAAESTTTTTSSTSSSTSNTTPPPPKKQKRKKGQCTKKTQGDIPRSIWENFRAYGLPRPEVVRMDNHLFDQHCRGAVVAGMFDAIVTDPPVRHGGEGAVCCDAGLS